MLRTAVLFTAYNDGETLGPLLLVTTRITTGMNVDIWIVNDGSCDDTDAIAETNGCLLVTHSKNCGVGCAYKTGFSKILEHGGYDIVIKIDADGQHDPAFIPRVIREIENGADLVVCSRFHPRSEQDGTPLDRVLLNNLFASELRRMTSWGITDARSGFFGIRTEMLSAITPRLITTGYGIPMEVFLRTWNQFPDAVHREIPHPAIYKRHSNGRRTEQYANEQVEHKFTRFQQAYNALHSVYCDIGITSRDLLSF